MPNPRNGHIAIPIPKLVGKSRTIREVERFARQAAVSNLSLFIRGETGVGKDHLAELIHYMSRPRERFVVVDCGALSEGVSESELFGHVRGAFTSATEDKAGVITLAGQGTLFFNEVANMSLSLQAKFLRILEKKPYRPVGGRADLPVSARIIAATKANVEAEIKAGRFRDDLFHRLNVISFTILPLRDRKDDIADLVAHFWGEGNKKVFPEAVLAQMIEYEWPGNVRELKHAVEREIFRAGTEIAFSNLGSMVNDDLPVGEIPSGGGAFEVSAPGITIEGIVHALHVLPGKLDEKLNAIQKGIIEAVLLVTDGNKSEAAERLGIKRSTLGDRISQLDIEDEGKKKK